MNIPLNINWQQILLHFLNFAILAGGLYFILYKPVKKFMDKRQELYKARDEESEAKMQEAEEMKASYEKKIAEADKEITALKEKASHEASEAANVRITKAKEEADAILNKAIAKAEAEKEKMIEEANKEIAYIAVTATKKIITEKNEDAYDEFIKSLERSEPDGE